MKALYFLQGEGCRWLPVPKQFQNNLDINDCEVVRETTAYSHILQQEVLSKQACLLSDDKKLKLHFFGIFTEGGCIYEMDPESCKLKFREKSLTWLARLIGSQILEDRVQNFVYPQPK